MIGSPVVHYRKTGFFLWVLKKGAHKFVCCFPSFVVFSNLFHYSPCNKIKNRNETENQSVAASLLRRQDSNMRPPGYEPGELPTAPLRDVISHLRVQRYCFYLNYARKKGNILLKAR